MSAKSAASAADATELEQLKGALLRVKADVRESKITVKGVNELQALLSRSDVARKLFTLKKSNGIGVVIYVLKNAEDLSVKRSLLKIFQMIATTKPKFAQRIVLRGGSKAIVAFLRTKPTDPTVITPALTTLTECARFDKQLPLFVRLNGVLPLIMSWLEENKSRPFQLVCFKALRCFCRSDNNVTQLGKAGFVPVLREAIAAFTDDDDQSELLLLAARMTSSSGKNVKRLMEAEGMPLVLSIVARGAATVSDDPACAAAPAVTDPTAMTVHARVAAALTLLENTSQTETGSRAFIKEGGFSVLYPILHRPKPSCPKEIQASVTTVLTRCQPTIILPRSAKYMEKLDVFPLKFDRWQAEIAHRGAPPKPPAPLDGSAPAEPVAPPADFYDEHADEHVSRFFDELDLSRTNGRVALDAESEAFASPDFLVHAIRPVRPLREEHAPHPQPGPEGYFTAPIGLVADLLKEQFDRAAAPELLLNDLVYDRDGVTVTETDKGEKEKESKPKSKKRAAKEKKEAAAAAAAAAAGAGPSESRKLVSTGSLASLLSSTEDDGPESLDVVVPERPGMSAALEFDSRFESGNLHRAFRIYEYEYDLLLQPDTNTTGHLQWYYFSVRNMVPGQVYTFNMVNLEKANSQSNFGMKPLLYSVMDSHVNGVGWRRAGERISYYRNAYHRLNKAKALFHHTLTFQLTFTHAGDTVFLAYHFPYTYSTMRRELAAHMTAPRAADRLRVQRLCTTLAGNAVPLMTISDFSAAGLNEAPLHRREYVVLSGRVHPGESNASWMMKGMIDFLLSDEPVARTLRQRFVFKIIPMLNPDGVINGFHRTSLTGLDLNRQWINPSKYLTPTVFYAKQLLRYLTQTLNKEPLVYCDLHGHSRRKDIFIFGCNSKSDNKERVFPRMLADALSYFSFSQCDFKVRKSKDSAARVVVWRQLGVTCSYTMEASFCGASGNDGSHFHESHLEAMGKTFCVTLLDMLNPAAVDAVKARLAGTPQEKDGDKSDDDGSDSDFPEDKEPPAPRGEEDEAEVDENVQPDDAGGAEGAGGDDDDEEEELQTWVAF